MIEHLIKWLQSLQRQTHANEPAAYPVQTPYAGKQTLPVWIGKRTAPMIPTDAGLITNIRYRING